MYDFDTIIDRRDSDSAKWRKYRGREIIPMWVADMDFASPPEVIQALRQRVDHGIFGYGMPSRELNGTIVNYLKRNFDWSIKTGWIVWLPGLVTGLNAVCRSVGEPGDRIMTTVPIYPPFLSSPGFSQRQLSTTRMIYHGGRWCIDMDDLDASIDGKTRLFNLCNPHNPTGRVFTRSELMQLAQICQKHDLTICSDEIHCDLVLDPDSHHIPMASISAEIARRTITLMAPSKSYNIPGLGCSFAIISNDSLRRRFKRIISGIVPHVNVMGLIAAQNAYQFGGPWLKELIDYLRKNRDLVHNTIDGMLPLKMGQVEATYLAWINIEGLNLSHPAKWFETEAGVGLSDGIEFDGKGHVRLNFGCPRQVLKGALNRITKAIGKL